MRQITSRGSVWMFNEDELLYLRMPRDEQPRRKDWSQGPMEDLVWHPYLGWEFRTAGPVTWLVITLAPDGEGRIIKAPMP